MSSSFRILLLGSALLATAGAWAAQPASKMVVTQNAVEVAASAIVLPTSSGVSSAVFAMCAGCPPKTFATSAQTKYFVNRQQVTVADLKMAINGHPNLILTAVYATANNALVSVTADIPGARIGNSPAQR